MLICFKYFILVLLTLGHLANQLYSQNSGCQCKKVGLARYYPLCRYLCSPRRANIRRREERQKSLLQMPEDPRCNSKVLHKIMVENINDDVRQSKLAIVHAAESILGGTFSVICSKAHFSYIASTRLFCLVVKRVKCFAFLADYPIYERPRRIGTVQTS